MLDTNCKIVLIPTHSDIKGIPKRKQYNQHINILIKAKTINRCMEIYSQVIGYGEYKFTNYNREMGHNKSDNSKYIKLTNDYDECVMYELEWVERDGYILFEGFENKLRDKNVEKAFNLNISENLKDIMENGINFNKLLDK